MSERMLAERLEVSISVTGDFTSTHLTPTLFPRKRAERGEDVAA